MKIKDLFYRYSSFIIAKSALLIGKTAILILAYRWLTLAEFSVVAAVLSSVEIVRALSDVGAEGLLYARQGNPHRLMSSLIRRMVRFRLTISILLSLLGVIICSLTVSHQAAYLFVLPFVGAVQNSSFYFMQRQCDFKKISTLVVLTLIASLTAIGSAYHARPGLSILVWLMLLPEIFSAIFATFLTKRYWQEILTGRRHLISSASRLRPYFLPSIGVALFVILYTRLDVTLILPLLGSVAQSSYSAAFRFVEPFFLLLSLGSITLLAELGAYDTQKSRSYTKSLYTTLSYATFTNLILFGVVFAFLLRLLSAKFFGYPADVAWLVFLVALGIPIKLTNTFLTSLLQRGGRYKSVFLATFQTLLLTYLLAYFYGIKFGVVGVIIATIVAEFLNFIHQNIVVRRMLASYKDY